MRLDREQSPEILGSPRTQSLMALTALTMTGLALTMGFPTPEVSPFRLEVIWRLRILHLELGFGGFIRGFGL